MHANRDRSGHPPKLLKRLERAWKALCFRGVFAFLRFRPPTLPIDWRQGNRRVLFIRPDGIGDAIVTTALIESVAAISPTLTVDVLASPANAPLLRRLSCVSEVYVFDKRHRGALPLLARKLRRRHYDAVVDGRVIAPSMTGMLLTLASGAAQRFGVGGRGVDEALTTAVPPRDGHIIDQLSRFAEPFGLDAKRISWRPRLALSTEELARGEQAWGVIPGPRLLVNVSAGERPRDWPDDSYIRVIETLRRTWPDLVIRVIGSPTEIERVMHIANAAGVPAVETPSIALVLALVATADCVFTPDTCVVHMASAFRKPAVAMYLRGTATQWGGYGIPGANLESPTMLLRDLDVESVHVAVREMVGSVFEALGLTRSSGLAVEPTHPSN